MDESNEKRREKTYLSLMYERSRARALFLGGGMEIRNLGFPDHPEENEET